MAGRGAIEEFDIEVEKRGQFFLEERAAVPLGNVFGQKENRGTGQAETSAGAIGSEAMAIPP